MWPANSALFIEVWPIALKQLKSLTTIDTFCWLWNPEVMHQTRVRDPRLWQGLLYLIIVFVVVVLLLLSPKHIISYVTKFCNSICNLTVNSFCISNVHRQPSPRHRRPIRGQHHPRSINAATSRRHRIQRRRRQDNNITATRSHHPSASIRTHRHSSKIPRAATRQRRTLQTLKSTRALHHQKTTQQAGRQADGHQRILVEAVDYVSSCICLMCTSAFCIFYCVLY